MTDDTRHHYFRTDPEEVVAWQYTGEYIRPEGVPDDLDLREIPGEGLYWFDAGGNQRIYPGDWIVWDEDGGFTSWPDTLFRETFSQKDHQLAATNNDNLVERVAGALWQGVQAQMGARSESVADMKRVAPEIYLHMCDLARVAIAEMEGTP